MSTASNSLTALAPRTSFVNPYSHGGARRMSNASNLEDNGAFFNSCHDVPAVVTRTQFEEMARRMVIEELQKVPLAQLEAILESRRRDEWI